MDMNTNNIPLIVVPTAIIKCGSMFLVYVPVYEQSAKIF